MYFNIISKNKELDGNIAVGSAIFQIFALYTPRFHDMNDMLQDSGIIEQAYNFDTHKMDIYLKEDYSLGKHLELLARRLHGDVEYDEFAHELQTVQEFMSNTLKLE